MKTLSALIILLAPQERVSPDLLDYQPGGTLKGALELGPPGGFETLLTRWGDRMKAHHPDLRGGAPDAVGTGTPDASGVGGESGWSLGPPCRGGTGNWRPAGA